MFLHMIGVDWGQSIFKVRGRWWGAHLSGLIITHNASFLHPLPFEARRSTRNPSKMLSNGFEHFSNILDILNTSNGPWSHTAYQIPIQLVFPCRHIVIHHILVPWSFLTVAYLFPICLSTYFKLVFRTICTLATHQLQWNSFPPHPSVSV